MTPIQQRADKYAGEHVSNVSQRAKLREAYLAGADDVMSLPLAERLTPFERGRVQTLYLSANSRLQTRRNAKCYNQVSELDNEYQKGFNMGVVVALKHIFGKEMFELKGGSHE